MVLIGFQDFNIFIDGFNRISRFFLLMVLIGFQDFNIFIDGFYGILRF